MPIDEEETTSMRELVQQIDAHAEPDETEATSILSAQDQPGGDLHSPVADQQQIRLDPLFHQLNFQTDSSMLLFLFYCLLVLFLFQ